MLRFRLLITELLPNSFSFWLYSQLCRRVNQFCGFSAISPLQECGQGKTVGKFLRNGWRASESGLDRTHGQTTHQIALEQQDEQETRQDGGGAKGRAVTKCPGREGGYLDRNGLERA